MKKLFYFIIVAGVLGIMQSCSYNEYVEPVAPPIDTLKVYSFVTDVQPIFDSKCIGCHGGLGGLYLELGDSYNNIVPSMINETNPEESLIYTKPKSGHSANYEVEQAQTVLQWIIQGAENN